LLGHFQNLIESRYRGKIDIGLISNKFSIASTISTPAYKLGSSVVLSKPSHNLERKT